MQCPIYFTVRLCCLAPPFVGSSVLKDKISSSNVVFDCDVDVCRLLLVKVELMMLKEGVMLLLVHFLPTWQGNIDTRFLF
jgi:hypothetical protein